MESHYTTSDIMKKTYELLQEGKRFVLASVIGASGSTPRGTGAKMIVTEEGKVYGTIGGGCVESYVYQEAKKVLSDGVLRVVKADLGDDSWSGVGMACGGNVEMVVELMEPSSRIILLGSGHVAKAIAHVADFSGFKVIVVDPYAKAEDFPSAEMVLGESYSEGLPKFDIFKTDNVVIVTRHHADAPALEAALKTKAGYIGMIGSKNRVQLVYEELLQKGLGRERLLQVHAPIGLDIEAETPEEVAVSIVAEIIMEKRGGQGGSMALKDLKKSPEVASQTKR